MDGETEAAGLRALSAVVAALERAMRGRLGLAQALLAVRDQAALVRRDRGSGFEGEIELESQLGSPSRQSQHSQYSQQSQSQQYQHSRQDTPFQLQQPHRERAVHELLARLDLVETPRGRRVPLEDVSTWR